MKPDEIAKKIIEKSGNAFHSRVARWLQENSWSVVVSPYYLDQSQQKAREIDLIAEKATQIKDVFGRLEGDVIVRLYIECKFITSHSVFWFTEKDKQAAERKVCDSGNFRSDNMYTKRHHYISTCEEVAKVFATESKTQEQEPIYKALNQVLNAFVSMTSRPTIIPSLREHSHGTRIELSFPVVVCSDFSRLFRTDFFRNLEPTQISDDFQLEVDYAYRNSSGTPCNDYFLIDFVAFDHLADYCSKLEKDAQVAAHLALRS